METIDNGLLIAGIIWGVLSIILFFKIWVMTNDIKTIKDRIRPDNDELLILRAIAKKDPNTENILFDALFSELHCSVHSGAPFDQILAKYKRLYAKTDISFPAEFNEISNDNFMKTYL